jgi:predicted NUDIX family NTP pyrophosphohydrolase
MTAKSSAGILLYRRGDSGLQVLLVHPGGPFWIKRDAGAWSIPKGEIEPGETAPEVARREFHEELGSPLPDGELQALGEIRQRGGKRVVAYAAEGDFDVATLHSNTFEMEWPPRSGRMRTFPEVDRAAWFTLDEVRGKLIDGQLPLLDRLVELLRQSPGRGPA